MLVKSYRSFPNVGVKIKNISNHQLENMKRKEKRKNHTVFPPFSVGVVLEQTVTFHDVDVDNGVDPLTPFRPAEESDPSLA